MLLQLLAERFLSLPRIAKRGLVVATDAALCVLALWISLSLHMGTPVLLQGPYLTASLVAVAMALPLLVSQGMYRSIFRHVGLGSMVKVCKALGIYGLAFAAVYLVIGVDGIPRVVGIEQPVLFLLFVGFSRGIARFWLGGYQQHVRSPGCISRVLIYGAGAAGRQLAAGLNDDPELKVVGFLDDDDRLHGQVLNGLAIYNPLELVHVVLENKIDQVLLAIPSATRARRNEILGSIRRARVRVRTMPGLSDLAQGRGQIYDLRDLGIEDLLGREPVPSNPLLLARNIHQKVVMVTGAGGSIGSELCRQIADIGPQTILLVESSEFALYSIHNELRRALGNDHTIGQRLVPLLANVRDAARMGEILRTWRPNTVYHAAAYKHVPLVEQNPVEGLTNNVFGTLVTLTQSIAHGVSDFVLISTDKAVRPTNVMGASKRLAEMVLQARASSSPAQNGKTCICMVRFGNVLASSGSVVPLFMEQIRRGGPITVTHPDITRYFMTIPEAAQLVIQAGAMASGGEVFVLNMGAPVKIFDLAHRMVEASGLSVKDDTNPNGEISIEITGLRPGEKLYEELLIGNNPLPTRHPGIMKAHEEFLTWPELEIRLDRLRAALDANDLALIRTILKEVVPGYEPDGRTPDRIYPEHQDFDMGLKQAI